MTGRLKVLGPPERAYVRNVLFALELLDAVTLGRVNQGLKVTAEGLDGRPTVNASGLFVWLNEDITRLRKITIEPELLPYQPLEIPGDELDRPLTTRQLLPNVGYPFTPGITAMRGSLIEDRAVPRVPVKGVDVWLQWLDEDGVTWRDAPTVSRTDDRGDFAAILRLTPSDQPKHDANGALTARLRARRSTLNERRSDNFPLLQGRVADPSTYAPKQDALTFVWDEMHP